MLKTNETDLIIVEDEFPILNPHARMIKEFKAIIARDQGSKGDAQGRKKLIATKELAYVIFFRNLKSYYKVNIDDEDQRKEEIKKAIELPPEWEPDEYVKAAIERYGDSQITPSSGMLESVRSALNFSKKMINIIKDRLERRVQQLEETDIEDAHRDALIEKIFQDIDKILDVSVKISKQLESLDQLESKYVKELEVAKGKNKTEVNQWQL